MRPPMRRSLLTALVLIPFVAACSSTGGKSPARPSRPPATKPSKPNKAPVRQPVKAPPPKPEVHMVPGLEGVIGATVAELTRRFGPPRLDVWEGDARKLQFTGTPCILDVYLYPSAQGREPQATYVEARRASDGKEVDRAACVAGLRKP